MSHKREQQVRGRKPRQDDALPMSEGVELSQDIAEAIGGELDGRRFRDGRANDDDDVWGER